MNHRDVGLFFFQSMRVISDETVGVYMDIPGGEGSLCVYEQTGGER